MVMVRLPDAGKMHFMHSDQQIFSGGGPRHPAWTSQLRCSQGRAPPDMVPSAPKPKILATPLVTWKKQPADFGICSDASNRQNRKLFKIVRTCFPYFCTDGFPWGSKQKHSMFFVI